MHQILGSHSGRDPKRVSTRRNFFIVIGALGVMAGWRAAAPLVGGLFEGELKFTPLKGVDGFRKIDEGAVSSAAIDPFFGLDNDRIRADKLQGTLTDNLHFAKGAGVPVAEFTDYNCPYCKVLSEHVHALQDAGEITLSLHPLPLLGSDSLDAARIALAVDDDAFHRRLMSARFRVDADYALQLARDQGRDREAIRARFNSHDRHIARTQALAEVFGIIGTPALVVGRTLVIGQISERRLAQLIAAERSSI
jgi:hypothetical protein